MSAPAKPKPVVQPWAEPFWEAARRQELHLQHCEDCHRAIHYPRVACPHCASTNLGWRRALPRGNLLRPPQSVQNPPHEPRQPRAHRQP